MHVRSTKQRGMFSTALFGDSIAVFLRFFDLFFFFGFAEDCSDKHVHMCMSSCVLP